MIKRQAPADDNPTPQSVRVPFTLTAIDEIRIERAPGTSTMTVLRVEGHASVFDYEYNVYGGPPYGWIERIERGAFDKTLSEDPDVVFLRNHEGMPLARTKSGTLTLEVDNIGLMTRADLDLANPEVQSLASALERSDVDEMSFAFRVTEQTWAEHDDWEGDEMSLRKIMAVNLNRGDVSAVTFGASDATNIDIMRSLEELDSERLVEARAVIDRRIGDAQPMDRVEADVWDLLRIPDNPMLNS